MTTQMEDGIPTIRTGGSTETEKEPKDVLILVFDWKGRMQGSYRLEGMTGCSVITSGGDGILYACTKDPETEQLSILRYKLF